MILICERCFAAAHQKCLRQDIDEKVPEGDWICQRCTLLESDESLDANEIECKVLNVMLNI